MTRLPVFSMSERIFHSNVHRAPPRTPILSSKFFLGLHFEVPKGCKWSSGGPSETPWACFGGLGVDVGAPAGLLEASGDHFGALGVASGPSRSAPGTVLGSMFDISKSIWECLLRVLLKPASSSVLVVLGAFLFASFTNFAKWQRSFTLDNA